MASQKLFPLYATDCAKQSNALLNGEWDEFTLSAELTEAESFDSKSVTELLDLPSSGLRVLGDVGSVDARVKVPVIHNAFFVPGKVPSLNDLLEARGAKAPVIRSIIMRQKPGKAKSAGVRWDLYNDIKQDWCRKTIAALGAPFIRVPSCHFGYVVVEETLKRDPSNICSAAVKFIEDGLVKVGAIPDDGWDEVKSIRVTWVHRKGRPPGVYVVMSDTPFTEVQLVEEYEDHFLTFI